MPKRIFWMGMVILLYFFSIPYLVFAEGQLLDSDAGFELSPPDGTFPDAGSWLNSDAGGGADAGCTTTAAHSGSHGLWEYTGYESWSWWSGPYQELISSAGKVYSASAWIRSPSASFNGSWINGTKACVRVVFLNSNKTVLNYVESAAVTIIDSPWSLYSVTTDPAPPGTAYVRFVCYLAKPQGVSGVSVANFDDCFLEELPQPELGIYPAVVGVGTSEVGASFQISNLGTGSLNWEAESDQVWLTLNPTMGATLTSTEIQLQCNKTGLNTGTHQATIRISSDGGDAVVTVVVSVGPYDVPSSPSRVRIIGNQLTVQMRLPTEELDMTRLYAIKGVAWSPAGIGSLNDYTSRREEFYKWYVADVKLIKEMNANGVYTFLDFGVDQNAQDILDYLY
ncbi:hypothetical protein MUP95_03925, partial [bacterium]|nr:hypothetical protein [bacterium]